MGNYWANRDKAKEQILSNALQKKGSAGDALKLKAKKYANKLNAAEGFKNKLGMKIRTCAYKSTLRKFGKVSSWLELLTRRRVLH